MKVRAGSLSATDRQLLIDANRSGERVCVHATEANVTQDQRGGEGPRGAGCYVGGVVGWDYTCVHLGGWSFTTHVPWEAIEAAWHREDAPDPCPLCTESAHPNTPRAESRREN